MREIQKKRFDLLVRSMSGNWTEEDTTRTSADLADFHGMDFARDSIRRHNMRRFECCICGELFWDYTGCNPAPIVIDEDSVCCKLCDSRYVLPARLGYALEDL